MDNTSSTHPLDSDNEEPPPITVTDKRGSNSSLEEIDLDQPDESEELNEIKDAATEIVVARIEEYVDESFTELLTELTSKLDGTPISSKTLLIVVKHAMEILEGKKYTGPQKKQITINLVKSIINDSDLDDVQKSTCLTVIDTTLDDTIDLIVDASNGNLNINQLKKTSVNCLTAILANLCK